jgi:hypothetical protein
MDLPDILIEQNKVDLANVVIDGVAIDNQAIDGLVIDDGNVAFDNYLFLLVGVIAWYYYFVL